jgi:hypothetical protein
MELKDDDISRGNGVPPTFVHRIVRDAIVLREPQRREYVLSQKYDQPNTSSHIFKFAPKIRCARGRNRYLHEGESAAYTCKCRLCSASLPQKVLTPRKVR